MVHLMKHARLILTDSGGLQEEVLWHSGTGLAETTSPWTSGDTKTRRNRDQADLR